MEGAVAAGNPDAPRLALVPGHVTFKTFETFDRARLPKPLARRLESLAEGQWVEEGANVLAFGLPGVGKSHAAAALATP